MLIFLSLKMHLVLALFISALSLQYTPFSNRLHSNYQKFSSDSISKLHRPAAFQLTSNGGNTISNNWPPVEHHQLDSIPVRKAFVFNDLTSKHSSVATSSVGFQLVPYLKESFLPSGQLTSDYYKYTSWRLTQRAISSTCSVFGTQSLLLALGLKKNRIGELLTTPLWLA